MSKVKLLLDVISDMRSLADSIQAVADAMMDTEAAEAADKPGSAKEKKQPDKKAVAKKEITLEEVRGKLAEISQLGKSAEVRILIKKYGGVKLSDIDPAKYADVLKEAEVLGNG